MSLIRKKWLVFSPWSEKKEMVTAFSSLDAIFELKGDIISKGSQSVIFSQKIDGKTYFIKRYHRSKNIGSWLGFSRFSVEARNQLWFNCHGVGSAKVVALGEEALLLKTQKGVLITEGIEHATDLILIAKNNPQQFANSSWFSSLSHDLAKVVRTLHKNRFCHNDLHWRNILVQQEREDSTPKVFLIDCPSGKRWTWPFLNTRKIKDLASLDLLAPEYLSNTQRLRFFMLYRQVTRLSQADKTMIHAIMKYKAKKLARRLKRRTK